MKTEKLVEALLQEAPHADDTYLDQLSEFEAAMHGVLGLIEKQNHELSYEAAQIKVFFVDLAKRSENGEELGVRDSDVRDVKARAADAYSTLKAVSQGLKSLVVDAQAIRDNAKHLKR